MALYVRERRLARLKGETTSDGRNIGVMLEVDANCRSPLVPLTVQTDISGMHFTSINRIGYPVGFRIAETGEQRLVIYDMLPHAGPVYLELTGVQDLQAAVGSGSAAPTSDNIHDTDAGAPWWRRPLVPDPHYRAV